MGLLSRSITAIYDDFTNSASHKRFEKNVCNALKLQLVTLKKLNLLKSPFNPYCKVYIELHLHLLGLDLRKFYKPQKYHLSPQGGISKSVSVMSPKKKMLV